MRAVISKAKAGKAIVGTSFITKEYKTQQTLETYGHPTAKGEYLVEVYRDWERRYYAPSYVYRLFV